MRNKPTIIDLLPLSKDVEQRCGAMVQKYGSAKGFISAYAVENFMRRYTDPQERAAMVVDCRESVTISVKTFGRFNVVTAIMPYVMQLCISCGVAYDAQAVELVTADIIDGFGYLSMSQIICALKYAREGRLKDGNNKNICTMYGTLSGSVVMDCINAFVRNFRNPAIEKEEQRARDLEREQSMKRAITKEEWERMQRKQTPR